MNKKEEIKLFLEKFISDITQQEIILKEVHFQVNKDIEVIKKEKKDLKRILEIPKIEGASGIIKNEEQNQEFPFVEITYCGFYKDILISEDKEEIDLFEVKFRYSIFITLTQKKSSFLELDSPTREKLIEVFAANTGKLIIFPYIRYLIDFLSKSGGITVPPIPPMLLKKHGER